MCVEPEVWIPIVIQFTTLVFVGVYTVLTYRLWKTSRRQTEQNSEQLRNQAQQFRLSNRPWVAVGDVYYQSGVGQRPFVLTLFNTGRLPAVCTGELTLFFYSVNGRNVEIPVDTPNHLTVFPHNDGVGPRHLILLPMDAGMINVNSALEIGFTIELSYHPLNSSSEEQYTYKAIVRVPGVDFLKGEQYTQLGVTEAT
jgi:hypothetical protein